MKRINNTIYTDPMYTQYQIALQELKNNNSDLQEKFEKLSKIVEDEWKDTVVTSDYSYEFTTAAS